MAFKKCLVLNYDFRPFSTCSYKKAVVLDILNKAEVINYYENFIVRTVRYSFFVPCVIRLRKYVNRPYKAIQLSKKNIFSRDGNACVYCKKKEDLTIDHLIPRSRGGQTSWTNLVTACKSCNLKKGDFLIDECNFTLYRKPYKPKKLTFQNQNINIEEELWLPYFSK